MKTLKESLLGNVEDALSNDNAMNSEFSIDTLPTVKDFEKGLFNNKWHQALWYCPNVINRYKSKYSDIIPKEADSIMVVLDTAYGRVVDCNLYFTTKVQFGVNKLRTIVGWNEGFVGANLRKYKQMAIDLLTKLANNPDKMDKMLQYSAEYTKYWNDVNNDRIKNTFKYQIRSFNEL
jgi:hypothetical protein